MNGKITCFKLNWYDCGLTCADYIVQKEITIYRNDTCMVYKELNGFGVVCSCETLHIDKDKINEFFNFLEKICDEWANDYNVEVCDGSKWKVRMWHSSHKVKTVCGNVRYPPNGKRIEKYIRSFITDGKSVIDPILFGCS